MCWSDDINDKVNINCSREVLIGYHTQPNIVKRVSGDIKHANEHIKQRDKVEIVKK